MDGGGGPSAGAYFESTRNYWPLHLSTQSNSEIHPQPPHSPAKRSDLSGDILLTEEPICTWHFMLWFWIMKYELWQTIKTVVGTSRHILKPHSYKHSYWQDVFGRVAQILMHKNPWVCFCMQAKWTVSVLILGCSSLVSCKLRVKVMPNVTENITHRLLVKRPTNLTDAFANAKC